LKSPALRRFAFTRYRSGMGDKRIQTVKWHTRWGWHEGRTRSEVRASAMSDVIDFAAARKRLLSEAEPEASNPILEALDLLALALADHSHVWTDREKTLYETAVSYLSGGCTGSD
jgi:hypothetical protein